MEKIIVRQLMESCEALECALKKYTDSFNGSTLINFSLSEADRKKYLKKYNLFSIELTAVTRSFEDAVASLSKMICQADRECDPLATERLSEIFEGYQRLSASISDFIIKSENVFLNNINEKDTFRPSELLFISKELTCDLGIFKKYLENCK